MDEYFDKQMDEIKERLDVGHKIIINNIIDEIEADPKISGIQSLRLIEALYLLNVSVSLDKWSKKTLMVMSLMDEEKKDRVRDSTIDVIMHMVEVSFSRLGIGVSNINVDD